MIRSLTYYAKCAHNQHVGHVQIKFVPAVAVLGILVIDTWIKWHCEIWPLF